MPNYEASIRKYLDANPGSAPSLGESVAFSSAGEAIPDVSKIRIQSSIDRYRDFLKGLGFPLSDAPVAVFIYSDDTPLPLANRPQGINAVYSKNTLYIHKALVEDTTTPLREYTHYALEAGIEGRQFRQTEVESAIADYLPATFLNSSIIGPGMGKLFGLTTTFVRDIAMPVQYDVHAPDPVRRGVAWSAAFWACRGQAGRASVDTAMLPAWRASMGVAGDPGVKLDTFVSTLTSIPAPTGPCLIREFHHLGIPRKVGEIP